MIWFVLDYRSPSLYSTQFSFFLPREKYHVSNHFDKVHSTKKWLNEVRKKDQSNRNKIKKKCIELCVTYVHLRLWLPLSAVVSVKYTKCMYVSYRDNFVFIQPHLIMWTIMLVFYVQFNWDRLCRTEGISSSSFSFFFYHFESNVLVC